MEYFSLHILLLSLMLFAGVSLNRFSRFLKMPILICFLGVGVICGPHCLNIITNIHDMKIVQMYGEIAICFIIFSGGLQTSFQSIKSVFVTGTILANAGVILTALITAVFLCWISRMSLFMTVTFTQALALSATFASTDAAAVFAILRGQKASINPKLQSLLEYESGSNDPIAFLLTSIMISIAFSAEHYDLAFASWNIATGVLWGVGMGTVIGFLTGIAGQWFFNWTQTFLEYNGLRVVAAVAVVLFCYGITTLCFHANPLMSCYVAGITMGNIQFNYRQHFIKFHDGISWLMQIILFTVLGTFFDYRMLFSVRNMIGVILTSLVVMFIARPAAVMLCMIGSPFTFKERLFTSWVGIRGSAPIMLAAMVAASVPANLSAFGNNLFYGVFTLVLFSILIQGSSLMWVAKKLGLILPYEEKTEEIFEYNNDRADGRTMRLFTIQKKNVLIGKTLMESREAVADNLQDFPSADMPVLLTIIREGKCIQASMDVILKAGDSLYILGKDEALRKIHRIFFPHEEFPSSQTFDQLWHNFKQASSKYRKKMLRKKI